ncbi:MAG TPA: GGDEF domain-containing protein [Pyrinomonadaceae bacterium]|nr:GGDEF domain-containing protein [Pyrinomonadaceae bacterium]
MSSENMNDDESGETRSHQSSGGRRSTQKERRPALVSLRGELLAVPIPLERDNVTIGRALEADVRLNDFRTSRLHARILREQDPTTSETLHRITDLGSTNGTLVNGELITEVVLHDGDKIEIGDHLFRFEMLDEIDREFQQQIHRLLAHDELTGLLTSKSFFSELRRESSRAESESRPFCVLMMDLDHFKEVNDTYGHLVGSKTLEETGRVIKEALRAGDVAARFGGEEFAAFLLEANYAQGIIAAERVRAAIEQHAFSASRVSSTNTDPTELTHHITISIGVAAYPDDSKDPIQLVELADSALYRAKRNGRNRICAYRPSIAVTEGPLPPRRAS